MAKDVIYKGKNILLGLIEPTFILAISSVMVYLTISGYYMGFFGRLSLPYIYLSVPSIFYLFAGHTLLIILIIFIFYLAGLLAIMSDLMKKKEKPDRGDYLRLFALIFFSIISLIAIYGITESFFLAFFSCIGLPLSACLIISTYNQLRNESEGKFYIRSLFMIAFIFLIMSLMIPPKVGDFVARRYLDGISPHLEVNLNVKDDNLNISNKTFNLVMYSDNKYYVIENKSYSNDYPRVYVIRDDQVKVAAMKQVDNLKTKYNIDSWNYWL